MAAGLTEASARYGRLALSDLVGPAAALARAGVELNPQQAYVVKILGDIVLSTPEGILSGKEAKQKKVGGEVLFEIW